MKPKAWNRGGTTMESKAKLGPFDPLLIVFPLGLLATSLVFDIVYLITGQGR
jgi:uncharacterized membrane protein